MPYYLLTTRRVLLATALLALPVWLRADAQADEIRALREQIRLRDQKLRVLADSFQSDFKTRLTPTSALLRQDEKTLITRLQVSF